MDFTQALDVLELLNRLGGVVPSDIPPSRVQPLLQFLGYPIIERGIKMQQDYSRAVTFLEGIRSDFQNMLRAGVMKEDLLKWFDTVKNLPEWNLVKQFFGDHPYVALQAVINSIPTMAEEIERIRNLAIGAGSSGSPSASRGFILNVPPNIQLFGSRGQSGGKAGGGNFFLPRVLVSRR